MILPYKPIHTQEWLEKYLSANYFKKKYDRYMWWRSYSLKKKPLDNLQPLRKRIENGDFELGPFVFEIELVQHRMNSKYLEHKHEDTYQEATQLDKARIKRLQEDRDKDERLKLEALRKAFVMEFNITKKQYDREVSRPNNSILSFYDKMEKRFGKRGWTFRKSVVPEGLVLAKDRKC
tara:strand:- start:126 stop:659 length:534 start_codon:yes stop_codon:yes gene_type:complete